MSAATPPTIKDDCLTYKDAADGPNINCKVISMLSSLGERNEYLKHDDFRRTIPSCCDVSRELTLRWRKGRKSRFRIERKHFVRLIQQRIFTRNHERSHNLLGKIVLCRRDSTRKTEIDDVDPAVLVHQDVRRLHIAVHHIRTLWVTPDARRNSQITERTNDLIH